MKDPYGNDITLWELRGKPAVIVFSPFTFTGTLQGEQCEIRDDPSAFERGGAQVLAISWDSRHSQRIWAEEQGVTFVLDRDGVVSSTFSSPDLGTPRAKSEYEEALAKVS